MKTKELIALLLEKDLEAEVMINLSDEEATVANNAFSSFINDEGWVIESLDEWDEENYGPLHKMKSIVLVSY